MEKKNYFYSIIIIFLFFLIYFLAGIYGYIDYTRFKPYLFSNSVDLEFHYKYSNKVNHLRAKKFDGKTTGYFFDNISDVRSKEKILFLGDSWFDQIGLEKYKGSKKSLKEFSIKNNIQIINGGTTSFSPSLMQIQYNLLKNDFNINPSILILHIDQTDIGDEYCRYREKKIYDDKKKLVSVERFDFDKEIFSGLKIYEYSKIKLNDNYLFKFIKLSNFSIKYFINKNFFRIKKIIEYGWRTGDERNYYKCRFKVIKSFLDRKNPKADNYFKKTLIEFLDNLENQKNLKKIIITSFPHRDHVKNIYQNNVSSLINDVLENYGNKFFHLNFSNNSYKDFDLDQLYVVGDEASHLNPQSHNEIFIKEIIKKINF
tara:strand:- start:683 stop:1795 length:1113 start_codon:yes stop_codon:yes gene_type:complete